MNADKRRAIFEILRNADPEPTTELEYASEFELLIAVMLSAQATDISVNLATEKLYKVANTPQTILDLGERKLKTYIRHIGLYNSKAANVIKTCKLLVDIHNSQVPRSREDLEALPGVGRKTANVILNTAFGEPTIAVDTHIFRVSNRTRLAPGKTPLAVEKSLLKFVPAEFQQHAHHWLILHRRYTCTARSPKCHECSIFELCEYRGKNKLKASQELITTNSRDI